MECPEDAPYVLTGQCAGRRAMCQFEDSAEGGRRRFAMLLTADLGVTEDKHSCRILASKSPRCRAEIGRRLWLDMTQEYVQYGCGGCAPATWLNFDCSPTLRLERLPVLGRLYARTSRTFPDNVLYGDIVRGLPVPVESCRGIYCSHILEHLALDDFLAALRHTFAHLRPGGVFRLVLPDLEGLARAYLADTSASAASRFMEASCLGTKERARGLRALARQWLGNSAHLWMWDERGLTEQLRTQGFKDIRRAAFGDAEDRRFDDVEEKDRFDGCLAMQCRK
jgi:hypothetical protein